MSTTCTVTGVMSDARTVVLDEAIPLCSGPVRVTVEPLSGAEYRSEITSKLTAIRGALYASGYRPRSKAEADAQVEAERDMWGNT
jgi:hypothetical protein